jgi:hypothetical protein
MAVLYSNTIYNPITYRSITYILDADTAQGLHRQDSKNRHSCGARCSPSPPALQQKQKLK